MFGHDKSDSNATPATVTPSLADDSTAPDVPQDELTLPTPADDQPAAEPAAAPADDDAPAVPAPLSTPEPAAGSDMSNSLPIGINSSGTLSNLTSLKQDALHELSPLIGKLDQTPDEKYATAKMVYEETKDQNILNAVYEAARNLTDDKAKAEAIYDIIKKINELK